MEKVRRIRLDEEQHQEKSLKHIFSVLTEWWRLYSRDAIKTTEYKNTKSPIPIFNTSIYEGRCLFIELKKKEKSNSFD